MTTSSGQQTTQQNTQTQPWQPAIPALNSILGNIQSLQGQSGINPTEQAAIQQLTQNAGGIQNLGPQYQQQAQAFGGGDPFNILNPAYQQYQQTINGSGITNPNNLNPYTTPGFSQALNTANTDITNQINSEFAGAGRSGSGQNTQTLARGLAQGDASLINQQYNQNVSSLLGGAAGLQGAGLNTNSGMSNNVGSGAALASAVPQLSTQGPGTLLNAGQTPFNLVSGNQGTLAGLTVPIAGLGGQSQSQGQTNTSISGSPLSALTGAGGIFGNLFGGSGVANASKFLGGLFGGA